MSLPSTPRRRPWLVALPLIAVLVLAAAWSGFWFYSAGRAEEMLAAWRQREAQAGRNYACERQSLGGFPFRFELFCNDASAEFASNDPKVAFAAKGFHVAAQVYDPGLLIAEISAPLTIAVSGEAPVKADWSLLQISLRGRPPAPERVSMAADGVVIGRPSGAGETTVLSAKRIELHGRLAPGAVANRPLLHLAMSLVELAAPTLHPMTQKPLDVSATGILRGLDNLRAMPIPARLRQLQAAGGRFEVTQARIQQGDLLAVAAGSLGLSASGRLDGDLSVTVAGIDRVLPQLGIDQLIPQNNALAPALGALDRMLPGLGQAARSRAGAGLAMGLSLLGKPAELEGRRALALPLRFADGTVYLGPLKVGEIAPLY